MEGKDIYENTATNIILSGEISNVIPLRPEARRGCSLPSLRLGVSWRLQLCHGQLKKTRGAEGGKEEIKLS